MAFLYFFAVWANVTPRGLNLWFWGRIARFISRFFRHDRAIAVENVTYVLGIDEGNARKVFAGTFENFAKNLVDLAYVAGPIRRSPASLIKISPDDFAIIEGTMDAGKGVIGITGHLSNWELFGGYVASRLGGIHVIAREAYDRHTDRLLRYLRGRMGVTSIYTDEPASVGASVVRGGGFLGTLADLNVSGLPVVTVEFFGRPAATPIGPALLARRTGAPLIPMCIVRKPDDSYRIYLSEPVASADTGDVRSDLAADTQAWSTVLEGWIRRYPEQWIWLHDRWSVDGANSGK
ncbi:MAG: lysophospholipid acyltransferase family protein [Candidatus Coatesbacteria bacterium]|nr:MAG: lysophospholipid acyltransferase family protein [Candidatus Coatesbacteria bacterium]